MTYGSNKKRDISRSALRASRKAAKNARKDKRAIKQRARSRARDNLDQIYKPGVAASAAVEGYEEEAPLLERPHAVDRRDMLETVGERRTRDHLGSILRWAEAVANTLGEDPESRSKALRSLLGPSLAGRHAMTHVVDLEAYDNDPFSYRKRNRQRQVERDFIAACNYAEARELYTLIAQYGLKRFNAHMRSDIVREEGRWGRAVYRTAWIRRRADRLFREQTGRWYRSWTFDYAEDSVIFAECRRRAENQCPPLLDTKLRGVHDINRHMMVFDLCAVTDVRDLKRYSDTSWGSQTPPMERLRALRRICVP